MDGISTIEPATQASAWTPSAAGPSASTEVTSAEPTSAQPPAAARDRVDLEPSETPARSADEGQSLQKGIAGWATRDVKLDSWKAGRNERNDQNRSVYEALQHQGFSAKEMYTKGASGKTLLQETLDANNIKDPRKIKDGTVLHIPSRAQGRGNGQPDVPLPRPRPQTGNEESPAPRPAAPQPAEQPSASQPEAQPAAQPPAAQEPAAQQPAAQEPAAQQPAAQQPAAQEPASQEPAAQQPAAQEPAPQQPAAQQPAAQPQAQPAAQPAPAAPPPPTRAEKLAASFGVDPRLLDGVNPRSLEALEKLPPEARKLYREMSPAARKSIVDNLNGSTNVMFTSINHKDAFIKGSAMGVNVFNHMKDTVEGSVKSGKITPATARQLTGTIDAFSHMTPAQRASIVQLLEADVRASRR